MHTTIHTLAFRGTGMYSPVGLITFGHIGIQLAGDPIIYGFHPTPEEEARYGASLSDALKQHAPIEGCVYDDTDVFVYAAQLARQGERCRVWMDTQRVMPWTFSSIRRRLDQQLAEQPPMRYQFPPRDGTPMPPGVDNCATWPRTIGMTPLDPTGQVRTIIARLETHGQRWEP
jgi:hypothetical protein